MRAGYYLLSTGQEIKVYIRPIPAKRKSRSKADDLSKIAAFVTINGVSISQLILFHTWYNLFPALTSSLV